MKIQDVLYELDQMKEYSSPLECQVFLLEKLQQAKAEGDLSSQVALNNEIVGVTRLTGDMSAAMGACKNVLILMKEMALDKTPNYIVALINVATTYRLFGILDESMKLFKQAESLTEEIGVTTPSILSLLYNNWGLLYADRHEYNHAKTYLERALHLVINEPALKADKDKTLESLSYINKMLSMTQLEHCEMFFKTYGEPMLNKLFPEYMSKMTVGLVGEGSECFGFDDDISKDHDYQIGFCIWLDEKDFNEIGPSLQAEYNQLIKSYGEFSPNQDHTNSRRGVFSTRDFYQNILHCSDDLAERLLGNDELSLYDWFTLEEEQVKTATNGKIFYAGNDSFSRVRNKLLEYYPSYVWKRKLANELHVFSQSGQYNYPRMMARRDFVSASVCISRTMEATMKILYLLNHTYSPYYKWRRKGLEQFENSKWAIELLDKNAVLPLQIDSWDQDYNPNEINKNDEIACGIEELAGEILRLLKEQNLVEGDNTFLDIYCSQIG